MKTAIVVGSGLAGLTAGYRLSRAGWKVTVLEREDHLGGRTTTYRKNGYLVDGCATAISSHYVDYIALLKEIGLGDRLIDTSNVFGIYRDGKVHLVEALKPIRSFLAADWMTVGEKARFALGAIRFAKYLRGVTIADPGPSVAYDDRPISSIVRECFGDTITQSMLDPLMRVVTFGDFNVASSVELFTGLVSASGRYLNVLGGIDSLPRELAKHVTLKLNAQARAVVKRGDQLDVSFDCEGNTQTLTSDVCVLTCPFPSAVQMVPELGREAPLLAAQTEVAPGYVVHLGYAAPTLTNPAAIAIPRREFPYYPALFIDHHKAPDRAPPGHSLFTIYSTPESVMAHRDASDEQIITEAQKFVEGLFPEITGTLDMANVKHVAHVCHMAPTGYFKAVQQFHAQHDPKDRVQLAGDYFSLPGQETAVSWGNRAARCILEHHGDR